MRRFFAPLLLSASLLVSCSSSKSESTTPDSTAIDASDNSTQTAGDGPATTILVESTNPADTFFWISTTVNCADENLSLTASGDNLSSEERFRSNVQPEIAAIAGVYARAAELLLEIKWPDEDSKLIAEVLAFEFENAGRRQKAVATANSNDAVRQAQEALATFGANSPAGSYSKQLTELLGPLSMSITGKGSCEQLDHIEDQLFTANKEPVIADGSTVFVEAIDDADRKNLRIACGIVRMMTRPSETPVWLTQWLTTQVDAVIQRLASSESLGSSPSRYEFLAKSLLMVVYSYREPSDDYTPASNLVALAECENFGW